MVAERVILSVAVWLSAPLIWGVEIAGGRGPAALPDGIAALRDQAYVEHGDKAQVLDLFYPKDADKRVPLIVWIHGGAWSGGDKTVRQQQLSYLKEGYAIASVEYRFSQVATFPAQIEDCKAAIRWLRAHAKEFHLDAEHIGVWGSSAGGHLAALLGTSGGVKDLEGALGNPDQSSRVQAVVDWFGPADLASMSAQQSNNSKMNHDAPSSPESKLIGGPVPENREKASRASPVTYVSKDNPPFLIMHGDVDALVPVKQSEALHEALKSAGIEATLVIIKGAGHGGNQFDSAENREKVAEFFKKHLKS